MLVEFDNGTTELVKQVGAVVGSGGRVLEQVIGKENATVQNRIVVQERCVVRFHVTSLCCVTPCVPAAVSGESRTGALDGALFSHR